MKIPFSFQKDLETNLKTVENIYNGLKISLGPTGKMGILGTQNGEIKILTNGFSILSSLEFPHRNEQLLKQLVQQAAGKSIQISGDGSTTTSLLISNLIQNSIRSLSQGYSSILLSNGLQKIAFFLLEKTVEFSSPVKNQKELQGVLKTAIGKKVNQDLFNLLSESLFELSRDGILLVEENRSPCYEIEKVEAFELEKGYSSPYFVNQLQTFEVIYLTPLVLITSGPIQNLFQIQEIIEYSQTLQRPLVLIAEEISKEVLSNLIFLTLQKKAQIVVIQYKSIQFFKTGILEDLKILTSCTLPLTKELNETYIYKPEELGQVEKIISQKEKTFFFLSKLSKVLAKRRVNELSRELLTSETEFEKNLLKTRVARLYGRITKIKLALSTPSQIQEERQKIEKILTIISSAIEEGILPGGGSFYLFLRNELKNWSSLNLIGDEIFASQLVRQSFLCPFYELASNNNEQPSILYETLVSLGYPHSYDLLKKQINNSYFNGTLDTTKAIRSILWNTLTLVSTLITSE